MWLLAVLALLLTGALLGGAGVRRLARWAGQATGRWRSGAGVSAVLLLVAALALVVRGAVLAGAVLGGFAIVLGLAARRRAAAPPASRMSEGEARSILGVGPSAGAEEIRLAYARLIQRVHPDKGGAPGLAAQLNAARDRLLD